MAPKVCRKTSEDHFQEVAPKNGPEELEDNFLGKLRKIWAKSFEPPKICLLLHVCAKQWFGSALPKAMKTCFKAILLIITHTVGWICDS